MRNAKLLATLLLLGAHPLACSGESPATSSTVGGTTGTTTTAPPEPDCKADADCASTTDTPLCDVPSGACVALPPGYQIGWKDGSAESVWFVPVYETGVSRQPTDLAFNPAKPTELWASNRKDGSVIIVQKPGESDSTFVRRKDPAADHFMNRPPAIAFGAMTEAWGQTWGTCGDGDNGGNDFMGAALFSADPAVFAKPTPDGLGSHLDMLHSTSYCRGIAHVEGNLYWVFNGDKKSLDLYDFKEDHGPGMDDHSDGVILRYAVGKVLGVDGVSSHVFYHPGDLQLYIADTGNKRIAKLDTKSGTVGKSFGGLEKVATRKYVDGAVLVDVVPAGLLEEPSGIEVHDGVIFVSDRATSRFHAFDMEGKPLRQLDTGLPPGSLSGFTFGPDGKIYFADFITSTIYRIDPHG